MFQFFGRDWQDQHKPHPWEEVLNEWLQSSESTNLAMTLKAIARNLMHDSRVSRDRELIFDSYGKSPYDAKALKAALDDFLWDRIRTQKNKPDFLDDHNAENFINLGKLGENTDFVRIIDLHKLLPVFLAVGDGDKKVEPFDELDTVIKEDTSLEERQKTLSWFLDEKLDKTRNTEGQRREFIECVIKAMNIHFDNGNPYHPTWATTWEAFEFCRAALKEAGLTENAIHWSEMVGVHNSDHSRWIIALRYKAKEAEKVVRPTQLDAGFYAHHFPSPPQSPLESGGHPMNLNLAPPPAKLLPEYIHPQIKHCIKHWDDTGWLCERTDRTSSPDLKSQRTHHYQCLIDKYGEEVRNWMPECV